MRLRDPARIVACTALCLAVATGCGGQDQSEPADPSPTPPSSSTAASPSPEPTTSTASPSPEPTEPAPTAPPTQSSAPTGLAGRLLTADTLPGFNPAYRWSAGTTRPESPSSSFGTCQKFSTTSIGAERALVRQFRPAVADPAAREDRAGELVAQFPDALTARRAFAVLTAWRADCAERLRRHTRPRVGPLEDVPVEGGSGGWYLLTYGPVKGDPNAQFFDAQGMVVVGTRVAMVSLVVAGQDYDYEAGQEPAALAVQRAAGKLA
jgi:hypothetical protein